MTEENIIVGYLENSPTLNHSRYQDESHSVTEKSESFLTENGISTGLHDENLGDLFQSNQTPEGTYFFHNSETNVTTYIDATKEEITVVSPSETGEMLATVYTTDPKTSGYYVNASDLKMALSFDGQLENPATGIGVKLSPETLSETYKNQQANTPQAILPLTSEESTLPPVESLSGIGTPLTLTGSFYARQSADAPIEEVSLFKDSFERYLKNTNLYYHYLGSSLKTYTELYNFNEQYGVFDGICASYNTSINLTKNRTAASWQNISTSLDNISEQYKDAFKVGNLDVSTVIEPIKESLVLANRLVEDYLDEISAEYSRIAKEKERILEELKNMEEKTKSLNTSDENETPTNN
ncbi:MAG: hypothetical protein PUC82_00090 [bacterium]|nr:hypothetical protein [bacterium]